MIGDGLGRSHPRRLGRLNFDDDVPHERLDLLSPLRHPVNPSVLILYVWQDNCTHPRVSVCDAVDGSHHRHRNVPKFGWNRGAMAKTPTSAYGY
jgi:hypothetical protein